MRSFPLVPRAALSDDPAERAGYMIVITFLVGLIALALGLFRLGFVVNFISRPVLAGFASASAIITTVSMLKVCDGSWELGVGSWQDSAL
jgi:MFS superfamily sulfate permease-like transporter